MTLTRFMSGVVLGMAAGVLALALAAPAVSSAVRERPEGDGTVQGGEQTVLSSGSSVGGLTLGLLTYSAAEGDCLDVMATRPNGDPVFRMGGCGLNNDATLTLDEARQQVASGAVDPLAIQGFQFLDDGRTLALAYGIAPPGSQVRLTLTDGRQSGRTADGSGYFLVSVITEQSDASIATLSVAGHQIQVH